MGNTFRRTIPQNTVGSITANGQSVSAYIQEYPSCIITMRTSALSGHSVVFEVSNDASLNEAGNWDGTSGTWYSISALRTGGAVFENNASGLAATPTYGWFLPAGAWKFIRIRATAHTSGTAVWTIAPDDNQYSLPVTTLAFISAGTSLIGDVGVQTRATTGGLASITRIVSAAASTNATVVKGSAGRVYKIRGYNAAAAVRYLKLYNKATSPTVGTDTPVVTIALKPTDAFDIDFGAIGEFFSTGIGLAMTTGSADADTGALTAADVVGLNVWYA